MNKLTKLLSVFIIAGAVGASVAGVAGCKKGGGHSHSIDPTKWENNLDGTHDGHCSCGELMVDNEAHVYEDGACVKCNAPQNEVVPGNVTLDTTSSTSSLGRVFTIVATISNASALTDELKVLSWEVEDPTVASITLSADKTTATVTCLAVGTTKITVSTVNGHTAEYNLTVENAATGVRITDESGKAIDRIALTPTSGDITIKAAILPDGASDTEVVWSSSNEQIATVTADANDPNKAVVHMVSQGDVPILITATVKDKQVKQSIFCTADTYYGTLVNDTEHLIINENFSKYETDAIVPKWSGAWGTQAGVFGAFAQNSNDNVQGDYALDVQGKGNALKIVTEEANNNNNRAEMVDTSDSSTHAIIDFGAVDGVVKGYANVKFLASGSSWTFAQFYGKDTKKPEGGEIFGLRTVEETVDSAKKNIIKVRLDGDSGSKNANCKDGLVRVDAAVDSSIRLYYEIDIKNDKITVYINGSKFYEATGLGITEVNGIKFVSGDGNTSSSGKDNTKTMSLDNIAVTHVGVSLDTHKADVLAKLDAEYAKYKDTDYTTTNWDTLYAAYTTAKSAIESPTATKESMNEAYETAVAEMKKIPTIAGQALYDAKEAYKTELLGLYPEASYTYNADAYSTKKTAAFAAIDAYSGAAEGLKTDATVVAKVNELAAVKNDTQAMEAAKADFKAEIEKDYPATSYTTNADNYKNVAAYTAAYDAVIDAIEKYNGAIGEIKTNADMVALVDALKAVETDAKLLKKAQDDAIAAIVAYRQQEVEALKDAAAGTKEATVYTNITGVIDRQTGRINSATRIEFEESDDVKTDSVYFNKNDAITNIGSLLDSLTANPDEVRPEQLRLLKEAYDAAVAEHADIKAHLDKVYNGAVTNINGSDDTTEITNLRISATQSFSLLIAKDAAYKEIVAHATEVKNELNNTAASEAIDAETMYDLDTILTALPDSQKWSTDMWAIHNATQISSTTAEGTEVGVTPYKKVVLAKIDEIAEKTKVSYCEVTLGETGETMKAKWGTVLTPDNIYVTAYNVTSASYNGTPITAEAGLTVTDDITIDVEVAEIEGFEASADWKLAADATAPTTGVVIDNALFSITAPTGTTYGAANSGFTTVCGEPNALHYVVPAATLEGGKVSVKGDNKDNPYQITVKSGLAKLDVYVSLSDSKGSGDRTGSIYYSIDGGLTYKTVDGVKNKTIALANVAAGTVIKIYAENASIKSDGSAMDARLYLAKVEAAIDEEKVAKTVQVTWKGAGAGGADLVQNYHYYDKITAPEHLNLGAEEALDYWHLEGADEDKWVDESTLHGGKYVYVAKLKTIAAVQTVTLTAAAEIEMGSTLELTVEALDTDGNDGLAGRSVIWTVTGKAEVKEVEGKYVLSLTEGAAVGETVKVKATVGGVESEVKSITVKERQLTPWKLDFTTPADTKNNLVYKKGDVISGKLTVTELGSGSNWNKGGYLVCKADCVLTLVLEANADFVVVDNNSNSKRSYTIADKDGKFKTHTMNGGTETFHLLAGTYTITFSGGDCQMKSLEVKAFTGEYSLVAPAS